MKETRCSVSVDVERILDFNFYTGKGSSRKDRVRENGGIERSTALQSKEELNTRSVIPFFIDVRLRLPILWPFTYLISEIYTNKG
jgi:hypothetical protein